MSVHTLWTHAHSGRCNSDTSNKNNNRNQRARGVQCGNDWNGNGCSATKLKCFIYFWHGRQHKDGNNLLSANRTIPWGYMEIFFLFYPFVCFFFFVLLAEAHHFRPVFFASLLYSIFVHFACIDFQHKHTFYLYMRAMNVSGISTYTVRMCVYVACVHKFTALRMADRSSTQSLTTA